MVLPWHVQSQILFINPILHTERLEYHSVTGLKNCNAKFNFDEKSRKIASQLKKTWPVFNNCMVMEPSLLWNLSWEWLQSQNYRECFFNNCMVIEPSLLWNLSCEWLQSQLYVKSINLPSSTTTGSPISFCMAALLYLHHLEENANIVKLSFPILKIKGKTVWLKTHLMFL
jgi:hypothetical protein